MNKKIAIIRTDGNPISKGFYNAQEIGLAKGLSTLGFDIDIFMASRSKNIQQHPVETKNTGNIMIFDMPRYHFPGVGQAFYPDLLKILKKKKYDFIQVNESNDLTGFWISRYAKKNNITCIIYQGMYIQLTGRILAIFDRLYDFFILPFFKKNINVAVAKTSRAKIYLEKRGFTKTTIIPVGLDTEPLLNSTTRDWYNEFNIPKDARILLYIGIFEQRRNIHFLIDIAKKLKDKGYFLLLAGKGPLFEPIKDRLNNENINNVILLGQIPQNHIKSLYEISDFFLLASDYEIYGMVVLEALYCGCPVISTKTAGPEDLIQPGINGHLIETLNIGQWTAAIEETTGKFNSDVIADNINQNLTWDIIAKKYINLFLHE